MGLKSSSSGKLFDQYLAGGLGAEPMVVGYENQLVEWIACRSCALGTGAGRAPARSRQSSIRRPTVYSAHPLIVIDPAADQAARGADQPRSCRNWPGRSTVSAGRSAPSPGRQTTRSRRAAGGDRGGAADALGRRRCCALPCSRQTREAPPLAVLPHPSSGRDCPSGSRHPARRSCRLRPASDS